jgi:hypothetical protein
LRLPGAHTAELRTLHNASDALGSDTYHIDETAGRRKSGARQFRF